MVGLSRLFYGHSGPLSYPYRGSVGAGRSIVYIERTMVLFIHVVIYLLDNNGEVTVLFKRDEYNEILTEWWLAPNRLIIIIIIVSILK